jgi:cytochrome P450 family 4
MDIIIICLYAAPVVSVFILWVEKRTSTQPVTFTGRKYALLKLKILLSTILRNFKVYSDVKEDDYRLQADIILKRADGFMIRLEPRKKNLTTSPTM